MQQVCWLTYCCPPPTPPPPEKKQMVRFFQHAVQTILRLKKIEKALGNYFQKIIFLNFVVSKNIFLAYVPCENSYFFQRIFFVEINPSGTEKRFCGKGLRT